MANQLFITEFDEVHLPEYLHLKHNIAVRFYDQLVILLKDKTTQNRMSVKLPKGTDNVPYEALEDFLLENGHREIADSLLINETIIAILADICQFIYEALNCAKSIRVTPAYSLIRKPFLENLIILEKVFTDEGGFLRDFRNNPERYDPGKMRNDGKLELIRSCLVKSKEPILTPESIFEIRFDKKSNNSIYSFGNLGTHLVTTRHPAFKTRAQDFNLIFDFEDWGNQLEKFYAFVPYLLYYTSHITYSLLYEKKFITKRFYNNAYFFRFFSFVIFAQSLNPENTKAYRETVRIIKSIKPKCEYCKRVNTLFPSDFLQLVHDHKLLCKFCLSDLLRDQDSFVKRFVEKGFSFS